MLPYCTDAVIGIFSRASQYYFNPGKCLTHYSGSVLFPSVPPSTRAGEQGHLHGSLEALGFRLSLVFIVHSSSPAAPAHTRYWSVFIVLN